MHNSQALTNRQYAIRQGAMRNFYDEYREGTGSVIVEDQSVPFQGVPHVWTQYSLVNHSATTSVYIVITRNQTDPTEAIQVIKPSLESELPSVALSPALVVDLVRTVFGLNISETAEVFGITRQTAYQWMKLTEMDQVRAHENRDRIKHLYVAAQTWQTYPRLKGRWLHSLLPTGNTVLDLLKVASIDLEALQDAYKTLFASEADRRLEEGKRTTQTVTALASAFEGLGSGRKSRKGES